MKKPLGVFGIVLILIGSLFVTPVLGISSNEDFEESGIDIKILFVIGGRIKVCLEQKVLYGFGVIVYTDGETSILKNFNISFVGLPFFVNNLILFSFCFYISADV
jgi:hypothetical protein